MQKVFIFFGYFKLSLPFYYRVLFTFTELADIKTSGNKCRLYYKNASSNIYKQTSCNGAEIYNENL